MKWFASLETIPRRHGVNVMSFSEMLSRIEASTRMISGTHEHLLNHQMEYQEKKNIFFIPTTLSHGQDMSFDVKILTPQNKFVTLNISHPIDIACQLETVVKNYDGTYDDDTLTRFETCDELLHYIRNFKIWFHRRLQEWIQTLELDRFYLPTLKHWRFNFFSFKIETF